MGISLTRLLIALKKKGLSASVYNLKDLTVRWKQGAKEISVFFDEAGMSKGFRRTENMGEVELITESEQIQHLNFRKNSVRFAKKTYILDSDGFPDSFTERNFRRTITSVDPELKAFTVIKRNTNSNGNITGETVKIFPITNR